MAIILLYRTPKYIQQFDSSRSYQCQSRIKDFSEKAKTDQDLKEKLKACVKIKELLTLAREHGYEIDEVELYPPNEPQFTEEQLSEKLAKALLRA